jgi:hypothetical protein
MNRQILTAVQLNVVKLERHLGILACPARLYIDHVSYELGPLGNLGAIGSLDCRLGPDHHVVASLSRL